MVCAKQSLAERYKLLGDVEELFAGRVGDDWGIQHIVDIPESSPDSKSSDLTLAIPDRHCLAFANHHRHTVLVLDGKVVLIVSA